MNSTLTEFIQDKISRQKIFANSLTYIGIEDFVTQISEQISNDDLKKSAIKGGLDFLSHQIDIENSDLLASVIKKLFRDQTFQNILSVPYEYDFFNDNKHQFKLFTGGMICLKKFFEYQSVLRKITHVTGENLNTNREDQYLRSGKILKSIKSLMKGIQSSRSYTFKSLFNAQGKLCFREITFQGQTNGVKILQGYHSKNQWGEEFIHSLLTQMMKRYISDEKLLIDNDPKSIPILSVKCGVNITESGMSLEGMIECKNSVKSFCLTSLRLPDNKYDYRYSGQFKGSFNFIKKTAWIALESDIFNFVFYNELYRIYTKGLIHDFMRCVDNSLSKDDYFWFFAAYAKYLSIDEHKHLPRSYATFGEKSLIKDFWHPNLLEKLTQDKIVLNSLKFDRPMHTIFGDVDNGKSYFMRSVGLIHILGNNRLPCPAKKVVLSQRGGIYCVFKQGDDVNISTSNAKAEELRREDFLKKLSNNSMILLDELYMNINPNEGTAMFIALLRALLRTNSSVLAAGHLPGIQEWSRENPNTTILTPSDIKHKFEEGLVDFEKIDLKKVERSAYSSIISILRKQETLVVKKRK